VKSARADKKTDQDDLKRVQAAVHASGDVAYLWDLQNDAVIWSGASEVLDPITGGLKTTLGRDFLRHIVPEDLIRRRRALSAHKASGEPFDCEYRIAGEDGGTMWINERGAAVDTINGKPVRLAGTLRVVTQRKESEARLRYEVRHDKLTGLYNRLRLSEALEDVLQFNQRYDRNGAYFVIGIDHLSLINNAFGHEAGDAVLVDLSHRLDTRPPIGDAVGRVGGDCFGIIVADCPPARVEEIGQHILEEMRATPVDTPSGPVFVTASIGCAEFGQEGETAHDIMAKADVALREAKLSGRNTFLRYQTTDVLRAGQKENIAIAERVLNALKNDRLVLAYQPIVQAATGRIVHYECLLRMIGEGGEIIAAGSFVPVIEELGMVRQVDQKVLELAAEALLDDDDIHLAVNVSAVTAGDRAWQQRLVELIQQRPDIASRLTIEITETVALRDIDESARFVDALRELGCGVALDDFGAGNTSFRNLRALQVDIVKIDGSFVRNIAASPDNQLFLRSLVDLARGFGLKTVAECVETGDDVRVLREHGVDYLQGYYFGRPEIGTPWRHTSKITLPEPKTAGADAAAPAEPAAANGESAPAPAAKGEAKAKSAAKSAGKSGGSRRKPPPAQANL
jgi:diguanylate cyclase (GGDEF)-like protein